MNHRYRQLHSVLAEVVRAGDFSGKQKQVFPTKRDDYEGGNDSGGSGYCGNPPEETSQRFREDGGFFVGSLLRFGRCDQSL